MWPLQAKKSWEDRELEDGLAFSEGCRGKQRDGIYTLRFCGFRGQQRKQMSGFYLSWSKDGTVRHCQSKEASILWSHHEEIRELPGERDNARNNVRCTQARKTTHGLDGQYQYVDGTPRGRVNPNDKRTEINEKVRPWCGQPSDRVLLKNRTESTPPRRYILGAILMELEALRQTIRLLFWDSQERWRTPKRFLDLCIRWRCALGRSIFDLIALGN